MARVAHVLARSTLTQLTHHKIRLVCFQTHHFSWLRDSSASSTSSSMQILFLNAGRKQIVLCCSQSCSRCDLWNSGNFLGSNFKDSMNFHLDNLFEMSKSKNSLDNEFWVYCFLDWGTLSRVTSRGFRMCLKPQHEHRTRWYLRSHLAIPGFGSQNMTLFHVFSCFCPYIGMSQPLQTWTAQTSSSTSSITAVIGGYRRCKTV
jgi:hypothetical protein